ncbi:MAG: hypothetical protein BWX60_00913 [Candidatus Marinimicrobia bacterium ADurb.Bin030]|jgi:hypothetical protein|nr:MAG: hypothetical protein BWX60_00913 [Candidatus Marinimicrobia bacterium ADurb.Bin030]
MSSPLSKNKYLVVKIYCLKFLSVVFLQAFIMEKLCRLLTS